MILLQHTQDLGTSSFCVSPDTLSVLPFLSGALIFSLGLATFFPSPVLASPGEQFTQPAIAQASTISDGVYLYGQSAKPEQIGQEYLVFQIKKGKVTGAFYLPRSEFNCFSGTVTAQAMNLFVKDPYDDSVSPYSIALREISPVASEGKTPRKFGLEGYHRLNNISDNDRRILKICLEGQ